MSEDLRWQDAEELGIALAEKYPDTNPREVRLRELCTYVIGLPTFVDDPEATDEARLQAIQDAWFAEYQDRRVA
jgi:FeS assembly protein IscX